MKLKLILMLGLATVALSSCSEEKNPPIVINPIETTTKPSKPNKPSGDTMTINLLEFNDLHGHIEQNDGKYGLSNAAYLVDQIRNEDNYDNTVLLSAGDMFQETAIARLSYGRVVVECMNAMGFDMFSLGNHEFDWTLDKCLEYWDNDKSNGEASFPLLNANLYDSNDKLIVDENRNILPSAIIEREGVKIGMIGLLGDVYNSILASMTKGYTFKSADREIEQIVLSEGSRLKENGADIVVVTIHGADSGSVFNYNPNKLIANLKYNDDYLVDAVINGHTHTEQKGLIKRDGGIDMPVIQSRLFDSNDGNLIAFGRIDLTVDLKTKDVVDASATHVDVSSAGKKYNKDVQNIVDSYYDASRDVLDEVYCMNETSFKRQKQAGAWVCNLGMKRANASACIINTGGLRGEVKKGMIGFKDIYNFNPFDNKLILMDIRGYDLKKFLDKNSKYYYYATEDGYIDQNKTYKLAIIDYVFYSKYFNSLRPEEFVETDIVLRDLMIEELRYYKDKSFNIYDDYNNIHI